MELVMLILMAVQILLLSSSGSSMNRERSGFRMKTSVTGMKWDEGMVHLAPVCHVAIEHIDVDD